MTDGQKGVVADQTTGALIQGLTVHGIGDEGIHLRDFSSNNTVDGNTVSDTGMLKAKYGEGIYIGTAQKQLVQLQPVQGRRQRPQRHLRQPHLEHDRRKRRHQRGNDRRHPHRTTRFDGTGMTAADSWVDVKGNDWPIEDNIGKDSVNDGFQTHQILAGWGTGQHLREQHRGCRRDPATASTSRSRSATSLQVQQHRDRRTSRAQQHEVLAMN